MGWRKMGCVVLGSEEIVVDGKSEGRKIKRKLRGGSGFGISSNVIGWLGYTLEKCLRRDYQFLL